MVSVCLCRLVGMTVASHLWGRHLDRSDFFPTWNPKSWPPALG